MRLYGYARASSVDQSLEGQRDMLLAAGVAAPLIFAEKASGTSTDGRAELHRVLEIMAAGDVLVITRIDRLARSMVDFVEILQRLGQDGIALRCLLQPIDTSGPTGTLTLHILGAVAEFETELRRERQAEGIARAKAAGAYKGRVPSVDAQRIRDLRAAGMRPADIRRELGCSKSSVMRALATTQ